MGFYEEIGNRALIRELERELNTDVLLFGVDGFIYFGNLQGIDNFRVALLVPAIEAETSDVEILTPGGELRTVEFLRVDLWTIVGKGTGIVSDPIDQSILGAQASTASATAGAAEKSEGKEAPTRQESHELIHRLCCMIGDEVTITTLGGFLFEGILGAVEDELAIMTVEDVFGPATSSSISDNDLRSVVVNLEAITSVASATSTPA